MRVVLDANIIVSAAYTFENPQSTLRDILRAGFRGRYVLLTSDHISEEVRRALSRPFFAERVHRERIEYILNELVTHAERVEIRNEVSGVASHWQDDRVLETAISGDADYLVTGDKELLALEHPYAFWIVHPNDVLEILTAETTPGA